MPSLLIGCSSSDESDLTRYINSVKERAPKKIEPIPEIRRLASFSYPENENRRSPFKPVVVPQKNDDFAPDVKRPKEPLEAFPIDSLKFVGTFQEGLMKWALISQPSGFVTRVKVGEYMGQNYGQIVAIQEKSIMLVERVKNGGKWQKRPVTVNLRSAEIGQKKSI
jgi:type IV pilus assembly protein PilP